MMRKRTGGITAILALAVTIATTVVVVGYWHSASQSDRIMILIPPIIIPLVLAGIALFSTLSSAQTGKMNGWMIGFCLGGTLYLLFPSLQFLLQYDLVRHDGTGFWGRDYAPIRFPRDTPSCFGRTSRFDNRLFR